VTRLHHLAGAVPNLGMLLGGAAGFGMPLHMPGMGDEDDEDDEAEDGDDDGDDDMADLADAEHAVARDAAQLSDLLMRIIQSAQQPDPDGGR
jgi:hypothetical protein